MDAPKYGCNENIKLADDSIATEKCWKESYRGDSRKWLMRDATHGTQFDSSLISTMKAAFPLPVPEHGRNVGERRSRIMKELLAAATAEVIAEHANPPPSEQYCSEYDANFSGAAMERCAHEPDLARELQNKYPLYSSNAMSYWNFELETRPGRGASFPGLTASVDLKNPFKRHSAFTKPISEVLDECNL